MTAPALSLSVAAPSRDSFVQSTFANNPSSMPADNRAMTMDDFRASTTRKFVRQNGRKFRETEGRAIPNGKECRDWLADQLEQKESGEIALDAGCTKRAAENFKAGEHAIRMENLVAMCRNDPVFRATFFEFCGGELDLPPDLTAIINTYMRRS